MKIALLQTTLAWEDPEANREHFTQLIGRVDDDTDLVVLPETFSTGFSMAATDIAEPQNGSTGAWLQEQAVKRGMHIAGSLIVEDNGRYHNRLLWCGSDGDHGSYDKRHLFRMVGEADAYTRGEHREVFHVGEWRVCPMICYDLRFPVWSRQQDDYDVLLYVANWPASRRSAWNTLLPARAVENLSYSIGVNRVGTDGNGVEYAGDSAVYDYFGNPLLRLENEDTIGYATLDRDALTRYRRKFPAHLDRDSFTLTS